MISCLGINLALGHIPMSYSYKSAEPDEAIYTSETLSTKLTRETSAQRLTAVRAAMSSSEVNAYIVPTADAHNNQYIAPADARREWLSGLRGSSGTALVTASRALVWTDARYWTQFDVEVDSSLWELMRQGQDLSIQAWLVQNMPAGSSVGVDPTTYTRNAWRTLETALSAVNVRLVAVTDNLVDVARRSINDGPPARPNNALLALTTQYTGRASSNKINQVVQQINEAGANALLLTALDDIAYTLNLRGSDIPYNPVFFSYLIVRADVTTNNVILFWGAGTLSADIVAHLASEGVTVDCRPYNTVFDYLASFSTELGAQGSIWVPDGGSHAVYSAIERGPARIIVAPESPVALTKTVKNPVELQGFRTAHIKDGVAVIRALYWVEQQVAAGVNVTEVDLSDKLEELRGEEQNFMGPSFATIAGAGSNGAIIHYKPLREGPQRVIGPDDMLLVDSGGQYLEGTTDITRTRHMSGSPTGPQRRAFTRVMKGQIMLGTAVMPRGTLGHVVEVLARKALWDIGLNYGHGTGHGVGHFLNVHEGPAWILSGPSANDPGIAPAMIYSNEPGYYEVGEYGIRHEDLVETIEMTADADHIRADRIVGDFGGRGAVAFHTISLVPHQTACLCLELLNDFEIKYLNDYHARVLSTIGPILQSRGLTAEYQWLEKECAPMTRGAAINVKSTPILAAIGAMFIRFIM
ncbi:xaa-Pro aminopeptidase ApepP-like isoform X2 [Anticarsia gemmatalis]|uniref:xaa-Pro aminopeptidase ApepP-like isoform X2 n=1 Tax=Anticarsia gemmatalis TaxID=129554 RepID=UPI003F765433